MEWWERLKESWWWGFISPFCVFIWWVLDLHMCIWISELFEIRALHMSANSTSNKENTQAQTLRSSLQNEASFFSRYWWLGFNQSKSKIRHSTEIRPRNKSAATTKFEESQKKAGWRFVTPSISCLCFYMVGFAIIFKKFQNCSR